MLNKKLLECIYKFCDIDTRLKLQKLGIGIYIRIPLPLPQLQLIRNFKPMWFKIPRLQLISHKSSVYYIENKKYMLMYTNIHKRGPWTQELFIVQSLNCLGWVKEAWKLDLDTNKWNHRARR